MPADPVKAADRLRESPAGYHFYTLYRQNPRHFFLKYILGLKPRFTPPYFIFGGEMHNAIKWYYENGLNRDGMLHVFTSRMEKRVKEYEDAGKMASDIYRGREMLKVWSDKWRETDISVWEVIECERVYEFLIGPDENYLFTVRPDQVRRHREEGFYTVVDFKTSSWSPKTPFDDANREDQVTGYIWALRKAHPDWEVERAEIEVLYNKGKVFKAERPGYIYRTPFDLKVFEIGMVGTITEIAQKYKAWKSGIPWPFLFPRNAENCTRWGKDPYERLCRKDIKPGEVPYGFIRDEWSDLDSLMEIAGDWK